MSENPLAIILNIENVNKTGPVEIRHMRLILGKYQFIIKYL